MLLVLRHAVYTGRINYRIYIDSVRDALRTNFYAHVMNQIQERLYLGYADQRHGYTLYYYDRAGNRIRTIPPAGNNLLDFTDTALMGRVDSFRRTSTPAVTSVKPAHTKPTNTYYNTLNQPIEETTPDGGRTRYWYDVAGREIFSQNARQASRGQYTYNLYDRQGRIVETGQVKMGVDVGSMAEAAFPYWPSRGYGYPLPPNGALVMHSPHPPVVYHMPYVDMDSVMRYVRSLDREDVVLRIYDTVAFGGAAIAGMSNQEHLRKRISAIKYYELYGRTDTFGRDYTYASYYSYDIGGNVKTLMHDYPDLERFGQRYKRIDYDYDLVSGKVNMLSYNRSFPDQFYQRYSYDADNRIVKAESSSDGYIWQRDADYEYYDHGPLARLSLGNLRVQGVDYAYTIQGWLKAINGDILDTVLDMGGDGLKGRIHPRDVFAMTLDYFNGDYDPVGGVQVAHLPDPGRNLYNGNIAGMNTSLAPFEPLGKAYVYDQLNRLKRTEYAAIDAINHTLASVSAYTSHYSYDPDGNLTGLQRNGNETGGVVHMMDSFSYYYEPQTNRLRELTDLAADVYDNDIKYYADDSTSRYLYDASGNLIADLVSGHDSISWNLFNKVRYVKNGTLGREHRFVYDGLGNRVAKRYKQTLDTGWVGRHEYYVRAADGNLLAVYREDEVFKTTYIDITKPIHDLVRTGPGSGPGTFNGNVAEVWQDHSVLLAGLFKYLNEPAQQATSVYLTNHPVSFYTSHSAAYSDQMAHMISGDPERYLDFIETEWETGLLGGAMNASFAAGDRAVGEDLLYYIFYAEAELTGQPPWPIMELQHLDSQMLYSLRGLMGLDTPTGGSTVYMHTADHIASVPLWEMYHYFRILRSLHPGSFSNFCQSIMADQYIHYVTHYYHDQRFNLNALVTGYGDRVALGGLYDDMEDDAHSVLLGLADKQELLAASYAASPDTFFSRLIASVGSEALDTIAAGCLDDVDIYRYAMSWADRVLDPGSMEMSRWRAVSHLQSRRFWLSDHVLYGSSRLGLKGYWPGQYYEYWQDTGMAAVVDTGLLGIRHPWYSYAYNDGIRDTARSVVGMTATQPYGLGHVLGQRRYELANHLGNVQATLSDNRRVYADGGSDTIRWRGATIASAYDYYPFGMHMPGRYVEDTSYRCMTVTQMRLVPKWVYTAMPLDDLGAVLEVRSGNADIYACDTSLCIWTWGGPSYVTFSFANGLEEYEQGMIELDVYAYWEDAQIELLEEDYFPIIYSGLQNGWNAFYYYAFSDTLRFSFYFPLSNQMTINEFKFRRLVYVPTEVTVQICNDEGGDYRYGFNGQMKDNEVKGIGNSLDFGDRWMDTRIGRLGMSRDKLYRDFPSQSPYVFANNSPIATTDNQGMHGEIVVSKAGKEKSANIKTVNVNMVYYSLVDNTLSNNMPINAYKALNNEMKGPLSFNNDRDITYKERTIRTSFNVQFAEPIFSNEEINKVFQDNKIANYLSWKGREGGNSASANTLLYNPSSSSIGLSLSHEVGHNMGFLHYSFGNETPEARRSISTYTSERRVTDDDVMLLLAPALQLAESEKGDNITIHFFANTDEHGNQTEKKGSGRYNTYKVYNTETKEYGATKIVEMPGKKEY